MMQNILKSDEIVITSFKFQIIPVHSDEKLQNFKGYLLRGLLFNWLQPLNRELCKRLHLTESAGNKILREYSISNYYEKLNENSQIDIGVFELNIFKMDFANEIIKFLLNLKNTQFKVGDQHCSLINTHVRTISISEIFNSGLTLNAFKLKFLTPTAFKNINTKNYSIEPLPHKIIASLMKIWNSLYKNTSFECPKDLYNWTLKAIKLNPSNLKPRIVHSDMGKSVKFKGFIGRFSYSIDSKLKTEIDIQYRKWVYRLLKFGEYSHIGSGRTAGFGRYKILETTILEI